MLNLTIALDSVDSERAWQDLLSRGALPTLVALMRDLHVHHSATVRSKRSSFKHQDNSDQHIFNSVTSYKAHCVVRSHGLLATAQAKSGLRLDQGKTW